ncbi:MAG: hypothetical protein NUV61_03050, partial [Candidatus Azambacteria bacterium]|nr:hypothetical protein [Candidatus Azambacteria bacterium]
LVRKECYATYTDAFAMFTSYEPTKKICFAKVEDIFGVAIIKGEQKITIKAKTDKLQQGAYRVAESV